MKGISNYHKGESLATGFARPKVTSLFFDKIWLPNSLLDSTYEYAGIPKELLVKEDKELIVSRHINSGNLYRHAKMENSSKISEKILVGEYYNFSINMNRRLDSSDSILDLLYEGAIISNKPDKAYRITADSFVLMKPKVSSDGDLLCSVKPFVFTS